MEKKETKKTGGSKKKRVLFTNSIGREILYNENTILRELGLIGDKEEVKDSNIAGYEYISGIGTSTSGRFSDRDNKLKEKIRIYYKYNGLINRRVEVITSFTLGKGLDISSLDERFNIVFQDFLHAQKFNEFLRGIINRLQVEGEAFPVVFSNNEEIQLREINPNTILDVIASKQDYKSIIGYLRSVDESTFNPQTLLWSNTLQKTVLHSPVEVLEVNGERVIQKIFHWKTTSFNDTLRGESDLLSMILAVINYETVLRYVRQNIRAKGSYAWKRKLSGLSKEEIEEIQTSMKSADPPQEGSVLLIQDNDDWEIITGGAAGTVNRDELRELWLAVVKSGGIPEMLYGDASNGNYASSKALIDFTTSHVLVEYKNLLTTFITEIHDWVYYLIYGKYPQSNLCIVNFPELSGEDLLKLSQAYSVLNTLDVMSIQSISERLNLNYEEEQENILKHKLNVQSLNDNMSLNDNVPAPSTQDINPDNIDTSKDTEDTENIIRNFIRKPKEE